jgi:phospholipid transport system transporter-binding protein
VNGRQEGRIEIGGRLTIETVPALFEKGVRQLRGGGLCADLSGVEAVDSAAISMLLGWKRAAQSSQHDLRVVGCPEDLLSLARLYGVDDLLPLHDE